MKLSTLSAVIIFGIATASLANEHHHSRRHMERRTPKFLMVPGFKNCLNRQTHGSWTSWCLPAQKPEVCDENAWDKLVDLHHNGELPACEQE